MAAVILVVLLVMTSSVTGMATTGEVVGEVLGTDIKATIDGMVIPSYNINGTTAIIARDLSGYGFDVQWQEDTRSVQIQKNPDKPKNPIEETEALRHRYATGHKLYDVISTDIKTYAGADEIQSFNIGGKTAIYLRDLENFGNLEWDNLRNEAKFLTKSFQQALDEIPEAFDTLSTHHDRTKDFASFVRLEIEDQVLHFSGKMPEEYRYVMFVTNGDERDVIDASQNGSFQHEIRLSSSGNDGYQLFFGKERYRTFDREGGEFFIETTSDGHVISAAPSYFNNVKQHMIHRTPSFYLGAENNIDPEHPEIRQLAQRLTKDAASNYEKLEAVHQWVIENIAYDTAAYYGDGNSQVDAVDVLNNGKSVCSGYANLMAALLRSAEVPTRVVSGYALGASSDGSWEHVEIEYVGANHAWNEVYADDRWVIVDATWNAGVIENRQFVSSPRYRYFDPTIEKFSYTHLIRR